MKTLQLTAPSHWAPFLINGDGSDMSEVELDTIITWLESQGLYDTRHQSGPIYPVSCEDAGFMRWHDASEYALASDCQTYVFLV